MNTADDFRLQTVTESNPALLGGADAPIPAENGSSEAEPQYKPEPKLSRKLSAKQQEQPKTKPAIHTAALFSGVVVSPLRSPRQEKENRGGYSH